jgi:hypothetical protein
MTTTHYAIIAVSLVLGSLLLTLTSQAPSANDLGETEQTVGADTEFAYEIDPTDFLQGDKLIASVPSTDLSEAEISDLLYMREEEKLARDVYLALGRRWNIQTFSNIANSEQTHTDSVLRLIERYGLTDPASTEEGVFSNETLQKLYDDLLAEGSESRTAALTVGARIEDLDIMDLDTALDRTDNEDIALVYGNLRRGSENHLRAFNRQLVRETGENYVPEFISVDEFETIISSTSRQGMNGNKNGGGKGSNR